MTKNRIFLPDFKKPSHSNVQGRIVKVYNRALKLQDGIVKVYSMALNIQDGTSKTGNIGFNVNTTPLPLTAEAIII